MGASLDQFHPAAASGARTVYPVIEMAGATWASLPGAKVLSLLLPTSEISSRKRTSG
jgi:hypothetical protein